MIIVVIFQSSVSSRIHLLPLSKLSLRQSDDTLDDIYATMTVTVAHNPAPNWFISLNISLSCYVMAADTCSPRCFVSSHPLWELLLTSLTEYCKGFVFFFLRLSHFCWLTWCHTLDQFVIILWRAGFSSVSGHTQSKMQTAKTQTMGVTGSWPRAH